MNTNNTPASTYLHSRSMVEVYARQEMPLSAESAADDMCACISELTREELQGDGSTMSRIEDITVKPSHYGYDCLRITQDNDLVVINYNEIEEFVGMIRECAGIVEEAEPTPEKWYVVLKNSNIRITNADKTPTTFTTHLNARIYARNLGGLERTFVPISVDEYELAFGR